MGQIGRYEIIEQMGTGAMGNVYRARDTALDREIALKTIRTGIDVAPEVRQRFYREARACARLHHPNIVTVFDMGEVENTAYIAMELLEGADFRRIIGERRSISVEEKLAAAIGICDAIAHAHRHGVIHRDIKPSNLFLTDEGRTKVLDFGIARLPSSKLTVAGQILGTPNYMAPEQILARPSDGRADLFSAAVVFFELLTYTHPFQSNFIPRRIVQSEPDSLFDGNISFPVILEKVLARGFAKDPDRRYQTGDEFAADLRAVLDVLRGNASPGFSGVQLPSEQAIPAAQLPPDSASRVEPPEGQDQQEWRLSEALRLLPEFEAAIDLRDLAKARAAVLDLESRLGGDVRFAEAIRLCRSRLAELDSGTISTPPASRPSVPSIPTLSTAGRIDLDATFFGSSALESSALESSVLGSPAPAAVDLPSQHSQPSLADVPDAAASPAYAEGAETPLPPPSKPVRIARPALERRYVLGIAGGAVVCAILVLVAGVAVLRPVPVEPSTATAVVHAASTILYTDPGAAASKIASVSVGTRLNVLRLPSSRDQEWVNVQVVKPRVLRPGYVRVAELRDWHGQTGVAALSLIRTLSSGEAGSEEEISARIQESGNLASRFAGEPAAQEARLDIARLRFSLAQRQKSAGRPPEAWRSELKAARQQAEVLTGEQRLKTQALDLIGQIDELLADTPAAILAPPPPAVTIRQPPPDVPALLARARQLRFDGDFQGAERLIESVLRFSPGNKDARALRDKIKKAHDAENKHDGENK